MKFYNQNEFDILANNKGNVIAKLKNNPSDLYLLWSHDRVEFKQIDDNPKEQGLIRVMSITSEGCKIQYRAHQSLGGKQKEKTLMATAFVSKEDLERILAEIKKQQP